jgi:hypothetical protein
MSMQASRHVASPAKTALCAWLIPGGGYWVIGQKSRAITVFISVLVVFFMGILVGGIRVMDPPGWGDYGFMTQLVNRQIDSTHYEIIPVDPMTQDQADNPTSDDRDRSWHPAVVEHPMDELSDKPWFVGQVLCGPVAILASMGSVHAARPHSTNAGSGDAPMQAAAISHARSWEIGTLYTAVAGMLNLLTIIDAAFRSDQIRTGNA